MVDEARLIAQTIDPSISYAEGARITVCLMQIVGDQDKDGQGCTLWPISEVTPPLSGEKYSYLRIK